MMERGYFSANASDYYIELIKKKNGRQSNQLGCTEHHFHSSSMTLTTYAYLLLWIPACMHARC